MLSVVKLSVIMLNVTYEPFVLIVVKLSAQAERRQAECRGAPKIAKAETFFREIFWRKKMAGK